MLRPRISASVEAKQPVEPDWTLVADNGKNLHVHEQVLDQSSSSETEHSAYEFSLPLEDLSVIKKSDVLHLFCINF